MIKKYLQFIKEDATEGINSSKYTEIKDDIKSKIEKTIENSGGEFSSFVDKFIKEPEDIQIEGLINDSDIYEFYLKFRNDIDELLNDLKFFGTSPSESNAIGLYDYLIKGTQRAIQETVKLLGGKEESKEETETPAE
jgi:hypothetical protein